MEKVEQKAQLSFRAAQVHRGIDKELKLTSAHDILQTWLLYVTGINKNPIYILETVTDLWWAKKGPPEQNTVDSLVWSETQGSAQVKIATAQVQRRKWIW